MADLSDVEKAIAGIVSTALYPNGTSQPSAVGVACTVERGWPIAADASVSGSLDNILVAGNILVTVFPLEGMERNTTRFPTDINTLNIPAPTITATVSGQNITFAGTVSAAQNVGVTLGDFQPTQNTYVYAAAASDTPTTIAAGLAAVLVAAGIAATSTGPTLTVPPTAIATVMVGVIGTTWQEVKRQERAIAVTLWCPNPTLRDLASPIVDVALAQNEHLTFADGSTGRMAYQRTMVFDDRQTVGYYRRDLIYMVEYPTVVLGTATQIISTNVALPGYAVNGDTAPTTTFDPAATAFFARLTNQPTAARATLYNNLFVSLRNAGILPLLDALYITAAADSQAATRNLIQNAYNLTAVNAPVFTADRGYAGDGVSAALNTNFTPSTANGKYQLNNAALSVYDRTSRATSNTWQIGAGGSGQAFAVIGTLTTSGTLADVNNASADTTFVGTTSQGLIGGNRSSASATSIYLNGVNKGNGTQASASGLPTTPFYILARDYDNAVNGPSFDQIAAASIGGSLTDAQHVSLYSAIQAYMTGVGANV